MTVATESPLLERLKAVLAEIADLYHAQQILEWDARVSMPLEWEEVSEEVVCRLYELVEEEVGISAD